jgi:tetratricopeptide (TPR) repeat protein
MNADIADAKKKEWQQLNSSCLGLTFQGHYEDALADGTKAVALAESLFGIDSIELADSQKNLAMARYSSGEPREAVLQLMQKAHDVAEKQTEKSPGIATSIIHQHGVLLCQLKEYKEAEKYYKRALDIRKANHQGNNIIAKSLGDLVQLYWQTDRRDKAQEAALESQNLLHAYLVHEPDKTSSPYREALYDHAIISTKIGYMKFQKHDFRGTADEFSDAVVSLTLSQKLGGVTPGDFVQSLAVNVRGLKEAWPEGEAELNELLEQLAKVYLLI